MLDSFLPDLPIKGHSSYWTDSPFSMFQKLLPAPELSGLCISSLPPAANPEVLSNPMYVTPSFPLICITLWHAPSFPCQNEDLTNKLTLCLDYYVTRVYHHAQELLVLVRRYKCFSLWGSCFSPSMSREASSAGLSTKWAVIQTIAWLMFTLGIISAPPHRKLKRGGTTFLQGHGGERD